MTHEELAHVRRVVELARELRDRRVAPWATGYAIIEELVREAEATLELGTKENVDGQLRDFVRKELGT